MKSKILSYNHSRNSPQAPTACTTTSTTTNNNNNNNNINHGTHPSNRNRNSTRYSSSKYSTGMDVAKLENNKDNDKDMCNNNNEEVNVDGECIILSENTVIITDSLNSNDIGRRKNDSVSDGVLDHLNDLHIDSSGFIECNGNEHASSSTDEDGNNTDHSIEHDNIVHTDEESKRSQESTMENRTNLIVNYLPQNMSQEEMRNLFNTIGEVESCKLIRDKTTGQSLSYGFVNYQDPKDATSAIQKFNGLPLQNKMIKVSLARPSSETIKGANLYICGLPKSMSQFELEQLFSQYGTIITCRILSDNVTGNSKGVAFIRFDQRQEAEMAIKKLNGHTPPNGTEPITVKLANTPFNINNSSNSQLPMSHNQGNDYGSSSPVNNVSITPANNIRCMVNNMRSMVTAGTDISPRLDVVLQNNGHPSSNIMSGEYLQSNGHTIPSSQQVSFPSSQMVCPPQMHSMATFAMSNYPGIQHGCLQPIHGPQGPPSAPNNSLVPGNGSHPQPQPYLSIDPVTAATQLIDPNLCCLILYNLNPETKESSLWQAFGPFGAVHSVNIVRDSGTGKYTGFGFVNMPNYHEAILSASQLNGNSIDNHQIYQISTNASLNMPTRHQYVLPSLAP